MKQKDYLFIAGVSLVIFLITYTILALIGFVPEQFKFASTTNHAQKPLDTSEKTIFQATGTPQIASEPNTLKEIVDTNVVPTQIIIPKIGVNSSIIVPASVDVSVLDTALTKGAVYYPGSGTLQGGNMFLFGHSTNWTVVNNQAYKTFNNLEKLNIGDEIMLNSGSDTYVYRVQTVNRAGEDDVQVNFASDKGMLTISTCDTFGKKQDRWVVEAEFVKKV